MKYTDKFRGTGRTTRMVEKAIELAKEGKAVYIVLGSLRERTRVRMLLQTLGAIDLGIKLETFATLGGALDPFNFQLNHAWPACEVLVDHYSIEKRYYSVLKEMHRYNREEKSEPISS